VLVGVEPDVDFFDRCELGFSAPNIDNPDTDNDELESDGEDYSDFDD
jgi:hypothetical protein